jgi:Uma2 family endonuclease
MSSVTYRKERRKKPKGQAAAEGETMSDAKREYSDDTEFEFLGQMTYDEYCKTPETNVHHELLYGWYVREGTNLRYHSLILGELFAQLAVHVKERALGWVIPSSTDIVLDRENHLVLQPDISVVLKNRTHILGDKVFGAPNLVIEAFSPSTGRRNRFMKLEWYRRYGVDECWLLFGKRRSVEIVDLRKPVPDAAPDPARYLRGQAPVNLERVTGVVFEGAQALVSRVLPEFRPSVASLFKDIEQFYAS